MAPELHGKENRLREASLDDMKRVDVWAYAMVVFCIVNPGLKHPYQRNVEDYSEEDTPNCLVQKFIEKNEKPLFQEKYASRHQEEWAGLKRVYENCAKISPSARPEVREIVKMVRIEKLATTASENPMEVHLKVSQYTSVENVDQQLQHALQMNDQQHVCDVEIPDEATNACSFLTIMIAHEMHETEEMPWNFVAETAEITLVTFPRILDKFRDIALFYDIMEAYTLLKNNNCIPDCYYFTEELPYADHALSETGKEKLHNAMMKVASNDRVLGFFTCRNYIFLVGSYNSEMFILDTHPVPPSAGGRFTAILKRFTGSKEHACGTCCNWLWNRLESSNLNGPQSLSLMFKIQDDGQR